MKIKRVIVDEMPKCCVHCDLSKQTYDFRWYCPAIKKHIQITEPIPDECPLEVETDGWFAVSERLPDDGVEVLGYFEHGDYWTWDIVAYYCDPNVWTADDHVLRNGAVTHWRPLPEAPKEVKDE